MKMSPTKLEDDANENNWTGQVYLHTPPDQDLSQENGNRHSGIHSNKCKSLKSREYFFVNYR